MSEKEFSDKYDERVDELKELDKEQLVALVMCNEFEIYALKKIINKHLEWLEKDLKKQKIMAVIMLVLCAIWCWVLIYRAC